MRIRLRDAQRQRGRFAAAVDQLACRHVSGLYAGMSCAMAMLDPSGEGCLVDISMMEVAVSMLIGPAALCISEGDAIGPPMGNRESRVSAIVDLSLRGRVCLYPRRTRHLLGPGCARSWVAKRRRFASESRRAAEFDALIEAWDAAQTSRRCPDADARLANSRRQRAPARGSLGDDPQPASTCRIGGHAFRRARAHVSGALFDGSRPSRSATPQVGGPRRRALSASAR